MIATNQTHLRATIAMYAAYYRQPLPDEVVIMYADDLADLPFSEVRQAYETYRLDPKNRMLPLPSQIRAIVRPSVDPESAAREIAARITGAITKFGWNNSTEAREFIGEVGWGIVERQGGWMHICQNHGVTIQPSTFQAQIRDQATAHMKFPAVAMNQIIGASSRSGGELQSVGEFLLLPNSETE